MGLKKRDDAHHCFVFNFFRMELRIGVERERERERDMGEGRVKMLIKWHVVLCNLSLFGGVVDSKKRMRLSEKQIVLFLFFFGAAWVFIRVVIFLI